MITIYYKGSCNSSKKTIAWFEQHDVPFEKISISKLPRKELLKLITFTDNGFLDFLKSPSKMNVKSKNRILKLLNLSFNDAINYLNVHSELLHTPIIVEGNKFLIGYSKEEIRKFIPRDYRRVNLIHKH